MHGLPPLNAVKAFEVAARTGSFVLAAAELHVSSAAVSQQVRNLELYLGKQLFVRNGNRITLTDAGHAIYPQTFRALNDIAAIAERLQEGELRTRLIVSVPYSLAEIWLTPKLVKLLEIYPKISIDIRVEDDPVDFTRHNIDLRISYGDYHYPALKKISLLHDEVLPICSPEFWRRYGNSDYNLADIHESAFIHTNWGPNYASHPTWRDWFLKAGLHRNLDPAQGRRAGLSSLATAMARMGLGIALGQKITARRDLDAGRIIALSSTAIRLGHPYCAFVPVSKTERDEIRQFLNFLNYQEAEVEI